MGAAPKSSCRLPGDEVRGGARFCRKTPSPASYRWKGTGQSRPLADDHEAQVEIGSMEQLLNSARHSSAADWYLEGRTDDTDVLHRTSLRTLPCRIGRQSGCTLLLTRGSVSKLHAEIWHDGNSLRIRDLGSRNGTFVNGVQILKDVPLSDGDVLHFSSLEFRLVRCTPQVGGATVQEEPNEWMNTLAQFDELFNGSAAVPHFQPIVELPGARTIGFEVLARSTLDGLRGPQQMFDVAVRLSLEGQLSRLFRYEGVAQGQALTCKPNLFLNTHPAEMGDDELLASVCRLRALAPSQPLTLEIHEAAVTNPASMRLLSEKLRELNVKLAYDDFGAGQARLLDLIEVPPDFLKFDMSLVRDLHQATRERQQTVRTLVRMAHDLGICVLAEGIECEGEAQICAQLGFELAQGYYFGRPAQVGKFVGSNVASTNVPD